MLDSWVRWPPACNAEESAAGPDSTKQPCGELCGARYLRPMSELQRTPLRDFHATHGGRLVDFAGWEMPVQYRSILEEHKAVRRAAGLFDVSHMGEVDVTGPGAEAFLNRLVTNDVAKL